MSSNRKKKCNAEPMEVDQGDEHTAAIKGGTEAPDQEFLIDGDIDHVSEDEEGGIRMGGVYIPPAPKPALTFDATGPRLIITHIVNENFKSYAGVQTLGPFHKSFTAIIGPNGSGKSNVIDSMLFVFGYRATKIRSKKISVLLHKSSKHPNITSASVAVHFCLIIDGCKVFLCAPEGIQILFNRLSGNHTRGNFFSYSKLRGTARQCQCCLAAHSDELVTNS